VSRIPPMHVTLQVTDESRSIKVAAASRVCWESVPQVPGNRDEFRPKVGRVTHSLKLTVQQPHDTTKNRAMARILSSNTPHRTRIASFPALCRPAMPRMLRLRVARQRRKGKQRIHTEPAKLFFG
jgi:hypothetical protein